MMPGGTNRILEFLKRRAGRIRAGACNAVLQSSKRRTHVWLCILRELRTKVQGSMQEQAQEHTKVYEVNRRKWKQEVVGQINRIVAFAVVEKFWKMISSYLKHSYLTK